MDIPIQVDLGRIAQDLQIRRVQVESVVQLLDEGNTVPFITRYRKERTGNLNEVVIREIQLRVQRLRELAERKETILKAIEAQGKLTPDLATAIRSADNPKRLEDLYLPFKPKKRTKASDARDRGLEPLAFRIWTRDETLTDLAAAAQEFVNAEKGIDSVEKVLEGVGHILAEAISEMATVRDGVRKVVWKTGKIVTSKAEMPEGQGLEYRDYFDYSEPVAQIPPHRILAINRGDKEGPLKVRIDVSRPDLEAVLFGQLPLEGHPHAELFRAAAIDALERLILPSMEREVRRDLTEGAEKHAVEVFAKNLRGLLLQPPIPKQVVLAIDPGFRTGCKLAVLDRSGNLLDQAVIYPHPPQNRRSEAKVALKDLVGKHQVGVVAIGNGTACRETEELVAEIIAEGIQFSSPDYVAGRAGRRAGGRVAARGRLGRQPPLRTMRRLRPRESGSRARRQTSRHRPPIDLASNDRSRISTASDEQRDHENHGPAAPWTTRPVSDSHAADRVAPHSLGRGAARDAAADLGRIARRHVARGGNRGSARRVVVPGETGSTAVLNEGEGEASGAAWHRRLPSGIEAVVAENSEPHHDPIVAEAEAQGDSRRRVDETPPPSAEPVEPRRGGSSRPSRRARRVPSQANRPQPPAARPPRPPKQGGQGKSESSRSRSSRPRHGPPPPPEPPRPHPADAQLAQLAYVVVNEAGASVYSTSQVGRDELPDLDATLRSGISIGRRLQDPLAELVKIEPQNIGVGLYQHDVNPKQLKETLESVIASCVNFVGVDLNTASVPLLRHVSGLNQLTARRIVDYRKEHGPFASRDQLTQVEGVGPATFTQAAGFLKIPDGEHPLDRTWIHPESLPGRGQASGEARVRSRGGARQGSAARAQRKAGQGRSGRAVARAGGGRVHASRHHRSARPSRARPSRRPPQADLQEGDLEDRRLERGHGAQGDGLERRGLWCVRRHRPQGFGAGAYQSARQSVREEPARRGERGRRGDGLGHGSRPGAETGLADDGQARDGASARAARWRRSTGTGGPGEPREGDRDNRGQGQGRRGGGAARADHARLDPRRSALTSPPVGSPSVAVLAESPGGRRPERDRGGPSAGAGGPRFSDNRGQGRARLRAVGTRRRASSARPAGQGPDSGPQGRGGPRGPYPGQGPGDRSPRQDRGPNPRPPGRPSRPSPPPPPLSKDALAGNVPLRTFGQLKQLWEAKVEPKVEIVAGFRRRDRRSRHPKAEHGSAEAAAHAAAWIRSREHGVRRSPSETDPQGCLELDSMCVSRPRDPMPDRYDPL